MQQRRVTAWAVVFLLCLAGSALAQNPCVVPDDAGGTVTLPPAGCEYLTADEVHMIIDGLPPDVTLEFAPIHKNFICGKYAQIGGCPPPGLCEDVGGNLGGNVDCFDSLLEMQVTGDGPPPWDTYSRTLFIPVQCQVHTGPRNPGDAVQTFPNEMFVLDGAIFGDPDFDVLQIRAGQGVGLGLPPSTGSTTLTRLGPPGSDFNVDSFFDITYQIDFQGAPGSILDGMSGSTQGTVTMESGEPAQVVPATGPWANVALALLLGVAMVATIVLQRRAQSA